MANDLKTLEKILKTKATELNLSGNNISDRVVINLTRALQGNTTIKTLSLSDNNIGMYGIAVLEMKLLRTNTTIEHLFLSGNSIKSYGVLPSVLRTNTTLKTLDLSFNNIGDDGAAKFAEALKTNEVLTKLGLGLNKIGDKGVIALTKGLKDNTTLKTLGLGLNNISDKGGDALLTLLKENPTITSLALDALAKGMGGKVSISNKLCAEINEALEANGKINIVRLNDAIAKAGDKGIIDDVAGIIQGYTSEDKEGNFTPQCIKKLKSNPDVKSFLERLEEKEKDGPSSSILIKK